MDRVDLNKLHRKLCPEKSLGNFWRSKDFLAAEAVVEAAGEGEALIRPHHAARNNPSVTMAHPLIGLAFLAWADQNKFYAQLNAIIGE